MNKITINYKNDYENSPYDRDYSLSADIGEHFTEFVVLFRKFCALLDFPQGLIDQYIPPCEEENLDRISGMLEVCPDYEDVCENTTEK